MAEDGQPESVVVSIPTALICCTFLSSCGAKDKPIDGELFIYLAASGRVLIAALGIFHCDSQDS